MSAYYRASIEEVRRTLATPENGLADREAGRRLRQYGANALPERKVTPPYIVFGRQFTNPLIGILIVAAGLTVIFKELKDAIVIISAVLGNAIIGFVQESNAERSVDALSKMLVPKTIVMRDGELIEIPASQLVPGDVVALSSGMKVPADLRIIEAVEAFCDESSLTGESVPAAKRNHTLRAENLPPGDQDNMAFMGTTLVRGRITGIVVATGVSTVLGGIADEVSGVEIATTPLQQKIQRFTRYVAYGVLGGVVVIFAIGVTQGVAVDILFFDAVALAVAAIPESLPITVTVAMAVGIGRMARKNTIIRTLPSVETLGSTSVICSDKTGTITMNEMTVTRIFDGEHTYDLEGTGYEPAGRILREGTLVRKPVDGLRTMLRIGVLCNESDITRTGTMSRISGDPTEAALLVSAEKAGIAVERLRRDHPRKALLPFESGRNLMASVHVIDGKIQLLVKGSVDTLIPRSRSTEHADKETYIARAQEMAESGLRVLGFAWKTLDRVPESLDEEDISGLTFAGLQAMMDPPRPDVKRAIAGCRRAGVRVIMITGDHAVTAKAIAEGIGIDTEGGVVSGADLNGMSLRALGETVRRTNVFARVSPENKMTIVHHLMRQGEVVAVTGDGVNDAPMLRAAHLGVAMGKGGTDVARESANMILKNDSFSAIFDAVYEGRVVFENIRKSVAFLIPTGIAAMLTITVTLILGVPSPYHPAQLLWINLVTSGIQVISLSFEPGDRGVLKKKPRALGEGIMNSVLLVRTVIVALVISAGVLFVYFGLLYAGTDSETARTVAVTTMVFFQFFQLFNARSETESILTMNWRSNPMLTFGLLGSLSAHLAALYIPALEWLFYLKPLGVSEWLLIVSTASTVIGAVELEKWIRRRISEKKDHPRRL
jgi:Ca2+-transporting ATPase